jgi:hypothetical protein
MILGPPQTSEEKWIPGYEGSYSATRAGVIYSYMDEDGTRRELKKRYNRQGYQRLALYKNGVRRNARVHTLILETFVGPGEGLECDHIDGDKSNNCLENLEWVTHAENLRRAYKLGLIVQKGELNNYSVLDTYEVSLMRYLFAEGVLQKELADIFVVSQKLVWTVVQGTSWKDVKIATDPESVGYAEAMLLEHRGADYVRPGTLGVQVEVMSGRFKGRIAPITRWETVQRSGEIPRSYKLGVQWIRCDECREMHIADCTHRFAHYAVLPARKRKRGDLNYGLLIPPNALRRWETEDE